MNTTLKNQTNPYIYIINDYLNRFKKEAELTGDYFYYNNLKGFIKYLNNKYGENNWGSTEKNDSFDEYFTKEYYQEDQKKSNYSILQTATNQN